MQPKANHDVAGAIDLESYAPLMVKDTRDTAAVLVNGSETFQRKDGTDSGGQLQIMIFFDKVVDGDWEVVRTDETTLAEYHQALDH